MKIQAYDVFTNARASQSKNSLLNRIQRRMKNRCTFCLWSCDTLTRIEISTYRLEITRHPNMEL